MSYAPNFDALPVGLESRRVPLRAGPVLRVLTVEVPPAENSNDGWDHPDGSGDDDGEPEKDGGSDGRRTAVIGGRRVRIVDHLRRRPADSGARGRRQVGQRGVEAGGAGSAKGCDRKFVTGRELAQFGRYLCFGVCTR